MEDGTVIGVDVGGSHVTSAGVRLKDFKILDGTLASGHIDNTKDRHHILREWATIINKSIVASGLKNWVKLGFAMPGPFNYATGRALFKDNEKYKNLYNVSIREALAAYITASNIEMRFMNDAAAFGVGTTVTEKAKQHKKVIVLTLGTGFGAAFLKNGLPLQSGKGVPVGGCLWDKPFKDGIADHYFSTRWHLARYNALSGRYIKGVKEMTQLKNEHSATVFEEFGTNMAHFLTSYLKVFEPDAIIFGGNISKAATYFLPPFIEALGKGAKTLDISVSPLTEEKALTGASKLYDAHFWNAYHWG
ncbi:ROK family protein [Maribacter sp. 2307ULW6-5]|uniref:ROK family protein n=1 Tax=Maribacter sp. 2307ULW6-5 TaxID=3386275 RepID=UPI0039BD4904